MSENCLFALSLHNIIAYDNSVSTSVDPLVQITMNIFVTLSTSIIIVFPSAGHRVNLSNPNSSMFHSC